VHCMSSAQGDPSPPEPTLAAGCLCTCARSAGDRRAADRTITRERPERATGTRRDVAAGGSAVLVVEAALSVESSPLTDTRGDRTAVERRAKRAIHARVRAEARTARLSEGRHRRRRARVSASATTERCNRHREPHPRHHPHHARTIPGSRLWRSIRPRAA
jgi:hypothetical protein